MPSLGVRSPWTNRFRQLYEEAFYIFFARQFNYRIFLAVLAEMLQYNKNSTAFGLHKIVIMSPLFVGFCKIFEKHSLSLNIHMYHKIVKNESMFWKKGGQISS